MREQQEAMQQPEGGTRRDNATTSQNNERTRDGAMRGRREMMV
jgi:hypothetical protein